MKVTEIEEIERRKNLETDARVQQLLQDIRMQHEDRIDDYIREKEELYHQKAGITLLIHAFFSAERTL